MKAPDSRCVFYPFNGRMCASDTIMDRFQKKEMDEKDLNITNTDIR